MSRPLLLFSAFLLLSVSSLCQPLILPVTPAYTSDIKYINVNLEGSTYFYNYEYFKPYAKGFTQPGFSLIPTVEAYFGPKLLIGGGGHLKKYWGDSGNAGSAPVFYARYEALKNFFVQIGTIESRDGHRLSNILYNPLYKIDFRQENGMQLRYYGKRVFADAWVSWEHYLREGADDQEHLTAGFSFLGKLTPEDVKLDVAIPVQCTFQHFGGQINDKGDTLKKMRTLANLSAGIQLAYNFDSKSKLGTLIQLVKFSDNYDYKPFKGNKGNGAIYASIFYKSSSIDLQMGYSHGKNFYTNLGDRIYNNITFSYSDVTTSRNMYSLTGSYVSKPYYGVTFRFDAGGYYDPSFSGLDYYYGAGVLFNFSLFSK